MTKINDIELRNSELVDVVFALVRYQTHVEGQLETAQSVGDMSDIQLWSMEKRDIHSLIMKLMEGLE